MQHSYQRKGAEDAEKRRDDAGELHSPFDDSVSALRCAPLRPLRLCVEMKYVTFNRMNLTY
jgi:hypothetical protein